MAKPIMKTEIKISFESKIVGIIHFYATNDAAAGMRDFGALAMTDTQNQYRLIVDPRYDFDEILEYIKNDCT